MKVTIMMKMRAKRTKIWRMMTKIPNWLRSSSKSVRIFKKMKDCGIS